MKEITIPPTDYESISIEDGELSIELSDDAAEYLRQKGFSSEKADGTVEE